MKKRNKFAKDLMSTQYRSRVVKPRKGKGSIAIQNEKIEECEAKKNLSIKDLTGAGDLFAAGFLHGYSNRSSLKESLETGTDMSAKIIQQFGARL